MPGGTIQMGIGWKKFVEWERIDNKKNFENMQEHDVIVLIL